MAESTNTHTEAPGSEHHTGPFPPFQSETFASQLVWLAITFVLLYVLMTKVAIPRVGSILAARKGKIEGDLAAARRYRDQADNALAAYEKSLADARNRAQAIATETRDKLNAEAEKDRKALEEKLNAQLAEADKQIAATKQAAMAHVRGIAVDTASAVVARLTGSAPAEPAVAAAVDAVLKR
jgi:F-type H+-transporting ATPase subunit b